MTRSLSFSQCYPHRATQWRLKTKHLTFDRLPLLMGIVNATPDSFSDGGKFYGTAEAVEHGLGLSEHGAAILDVGGESTRPYSSPVDVDEELRRVIPVIQALCEQSSTPVSIDTSKAAVAREALSAGAEIINDITGLEGDPAMVAVAVEHQAGVCAMHIQGTPQTMQDNPTYHDVVEDIFGYLQTRLEALVHAGIHRERICLDPGVGFGKTHQHNLTLLANCDRYHDLARPLLVGHSRKGFIGKVLGDASLDRTPGGIGVALALARQGIQILRVHDVAPVRQALLLFDASGGIEGTEMRLSAI